MSTTEGMTDDYDDHSEYERRVAASGSDLVARSVAALPLPDPPAPVVLVDLGAATGRNSLAVLGGAVRELRRRVPDAPVVCVHNDLITNDWSELFANVSSSPDSYRHAPGPEVLSMASAGSFFDPTVPPGLAHLEVSFSAAHWLRHDVSAAVPEGFSFSEATGAAREALTAQADRDWRAFLESRAVDLAPGGRLIVQCVGTERDEEGSERVTARELLAAMHAVALDLASDGLLDPAAVERYVFPVYARTSAEARAPLDDADCPLEPVEVSTAPVANPYLDRWREDGDDEAYARDYAAFVRGFAESALRRGLFEPGVSSGSSVDEVVDAYFERLEHRFAARPEEDAFRDWTLTVVARRR